MGFLNVKALVDAFNKEKALVGAFSGHCENFEGSLTALLRTGVGCDGSEQEVDRYLVLCCC